MQRTLHQHNNIKRGILLYVSNSKSIQLSMSIQQVMCSEQASCPTCMQQQTFLLDNQYILQKHDMSLQENSTCVWGHRTNMLKSWTTTRIHCSVLRNHCNTLAQHGFCHETTHFPSCKQEHWQMALTHKRTVHLPQQTSSEASGLTACRCGPGHLSTIPPVRVDAARSACQLSHLSNW